MPVFSTDDFVTGFFALDGVAAFFVTADWIGRDGFMTEDHLRRLLSEGMLIGAPGSSHRYLAALSSREAL